MAVEEPFNGAEEGNLIIATCKERLEVMFSPVCFTVGGFWVLRQWIFNHLLRHYFSLLVRTQHNVFSMCVCVCACLRAWLPNRAADAVNPLKWRITSVNVPLTFLQSAGQTHSSCLLPLPWQEVPAEKPLGANF